ncbi:MAG: M1 family aminopeptidase [Flavobacteriales bacterium]|jgi:aminopeptidase N|nr:M1 family aminopeptidase [Flavobacteriales bacterium]
MRALQLLLLSFVPLAALAQPQPFGCHFHHGQQAPFVPLSQGQRDQIDETIARSAVHDILHYDIHLDVTDYDGQNIAGHTVITLKALQPDAGEIVLDLLELTVDSVTGPDGPMDFTHDGAFLNVVLDPPLAIDEQTDITVHYHGHPHKDPQWGGFIFASDYIYNLGIGISTIPPNFGKVWYPCFDSFVERATYGYHIKSAGGRKLHGQGDFLGEVQLGGDTVLRSYALDQPIPTHLSAIAVAAYETHDYVHEGAEGPVPVSLHAKAANLSGMVNKFVDLPDAIDACEHWYGPHPYSRVGYALTTQGALEIPTNIAYPQSMVSQGQAANRDLLAHELGHQWWGNMVTPHVHNHMWLKEGPAEYSGHLVVEWQSGAEAFRNTLRSNLLYVLRQAHVNDDGFQPLSPMPDAHIYGTHTYYKGAAVMHNLRGYLGDEPFREAMRGIQEQYAHTTMDADEFRDRLEAITGQDLDPFFDAWVFQPGYSVFEVRSVQTEEQGGLWTVDLVLGQKLRGADELHQQVPLDLTLIAADGTVSEHAITAGGALTTVQVQAPFAPAMAVLNRYQRLNQSRLDHELTIVPGQSINNMMLPHVDFRLITGTVPDTALLRVEHVWAPAEGTIGPDVLAVSGTHYWNVDGQWPEGTLLTGRVQYFGTAAVHLDVELLNGDETGICLLHRDTPEDPWEVYDAQTVVAGNLFNGTGYILLDELRRGQYAFGKTGLNVAIGEPDGPEPAPMQVFPVPANDRITAQGMVDGPATLVVDVLATDGRIVQRDVLPAAGSFTVPVDLNGVPPGAYVLRVDTRDGVRVGTARFNVVR